MPTVATNGGGNPLWPALDFSPQIRHIQRYSTRSKAHHQMISGSSPVKLTTQRLLDTLSFDEKGRL